MSATDRKVSCPACHGAGQITTPTARGIFIGQKRTTTTTCRVCLGHRTVHPLKSALYTRNLLAEHEAGRLAPQ